ncbi:MAG: hypothetical protein GVY10_05255 [Verrucomicrobia bacterium]|jgi:hypothetical protein|nr:hypothetical protein [Verrucomicrobiota bacterium]
MPVEYLVPVLIVFIVVGLPILSATLIKLAKIIRGEGDSRSRQNGRGGAEETEMLQEINRTLSRLEKRIDSLETIVLDKDPR